MMNGKMVAWFFRNARLGMRASSAQAAYYIGPQNVGIYERVRSGLVLRCSYA